MYNSVRWAMTGNMNSCHNLTHEKNAVPNLCLVDFLFVFSFFLFLFTKPFPATHSPVDEVAGCVFIYHILYNTFINIDSVNME